MLDLLIRLLEMRRCCDHVKVNSQLTEGEKSAAYCFTSLVRDCLPAAVLETYDGMETTSSQLLEAPEVFAMAVLVATYQNASPVDRWKLLAHFTPTVSEPSPRGAWLLPSDQRFLTNPSSRRAHDLPRHERGLKPLSDELEPDGSSANSSD